jgi:hypothetical protein
MPVFEAWRIDVEPSSDYPIVGDAEIWRWMGHPQTLRHYEIDTQQGDLASPPAVRTAMHGQSVETGEEIRKPVNLSLDGERYPGVRCISGLYMPAESLAAECRTATTEKRAEELRAKLENQARAGIEQLAGTDRFAGAVMVTGIGGGEGAVVRVDFVSFGAEGEKGLKCPYDNRKGRNFEAAVAKVSQQLNQTFGAAERSTEAEAPAVEAPAVEAPVAAAPVFREPAAQAPEVEAPAAQAPAAEVPAPAAPVFREPAVQEPAAQVPVAAPPVFREPEAVAPEAKFPGVLEPVPDSLAAHMKVIGVNAAENIRRRGAKKAKRHKLDRLPEETLRGMLEDPNPYTEMPSGPGRDGNALTNWWAKDSDRIVLRTAVEVTLAAKVEKEFADLATREVRRRGELSPAPLGAVRKARGKKFAAAVGRRAAVRTGELASMPEKERMARTRELHERVKDVGLEGAGLEDVAESVALQHLRNAHNEHEAQLIEQEARQPERGVTQEPDIGGAGLD